MIFASVRALYPPYFRVAELLSQAYNLKIHVFTPMDYQDSPVWSSYVGTCDKETGPAKDKIVVHYLPSHKNDYGRYGFRWKTLIFLIKKIKPDFVYILGEYWEGITRQFLIYYKFKKTPKIISHIAINHLRNKSTLFMNKYPFISRAALFRIVLWSRLDKVTACATKSMECARRIGLPSKVPITVNYLPIFGKEDAQEEAIRLPWKKKNNFIVGFAGLLSEQKGWKYLVKAMENLSSDYKLVIIGDGPQKEELLSYMNKGSLQNRIYYTGLLEKEKLLASYSLFDVFVLPSVTTENSVEQFGTVLAEAMACGVPVIGSDSGAIPETIGEAGIIVPECNLDLLAQAIKRISQDVELKRKLISLGFEKYRNLYSCEAYAKSVAEYFNLG